MSQRGTVDHPLREANLEDVPQLARLDRICFPDYAYPSELFVRFLELGLPCVIAEEPKGRGVLGFAMVMPEEDEGTAALVTLDVAPEARRRGLGTTMVVWCVQRLLDEHPGTRLLWLTVASRNEGARAFYRMLGFEEIDRVHDYYGEDDAVVMVHMALPELAGRERNGRLGSRRSNEEKGDGGPSEI